MSKRNVMLALNQVPDGSQPKNPYDLGHYNFYTSKLGQLTVADCIETVPDADYDLSVDGYTFTIPCNTASLAKMKENFYFLYVPFSQLVNSTYSFFVQRKDNQSSIDYSMEKIPFFNLGDVVLRCIEIAAQGSSVWPVWQDIHGFNIGLSALKLLDLLGYGCYLDLLEGYRNGKTDYEHLAAFCNTYLNTKKPNILRIAAYQKAWYCYFRNPIYDEAAGVNPESDVNPRCFNFDDVVLHQAGVADNYNVMAHRDIDNFIKECLQLRYVGYKKDLFTAFMPGTQYGAVSTVPLSTDAVVSGVVSISGSTSSDDSRWWATNVEDFVEESIDQSDLRWIYSSRTGINPINNSLRNFTLEQFSSKLNENSHEEELGRVPIHHDHSFSGSGQLASGKIAAGSSLFDVLQLVEAQAMQKWKQKSMLAGQRGINQYRAHYGVVPRHMEDHYPDFIGSVDNAIEIDRVINSANTAPDVTEETNLGDLGGRAYGASNNKSFHCHSTEHGVILVLHAIIPENVYSSYGIDRANQLITYTDFWQPEYQNIGLEYVPKCLTDAVQEGYDDPGHQSSQSWRPGSAGFGFAPRNYQLKQYVSKVHGMFNPNRGGYKYSWEGSDKFMPFGFTDMQSFVCVRPDLNSRIFFNENTKVINVYEFSMTKGHFYVSPSLANSVFVVAADDFEWTDPFIHRFKINVKAVQPLTVLGLPQF